MTNRVWMHGNALIVEDPTQYNEIAHRGWGTDLRFAGPRDGEDPVDFTFTPRVCHVAMPRPYDSPADEGLETLYLLFNASYAGLVRVDLWDGSNLMTSLTPIFDAGPIAGLTGDLRTIGRLNTLRLPSRLPVPTGLGISMLWTVNPSSDATLSFAAIGADFGAPLPIPIHHK